MIIGTKLYIIHSSIDLDTVFNTIGPLSVNRITEDYLFRIKLVNIFLG